MRTPTPPRGLRLIALALGLALITATISPAPLAIAAGQVYSACFDGDELRWVYVGGVGDCGSLGSTVVWHQRGPTGATGPAGPAGSRGPKGAKGPKGLKGKQGKPGKDGADGTDGEDGLDGARGATGPRGRRGAMAELVTYSVSASTTGSDGRLMTVSASCDAGDLAIGGGFETDGVILASLGQGASSPATWQAVALASMGRPSELQVQVICADLGAKHKAAP